MRLRYRDSIWEYADTIKSDFKSLFSLCKTLRRTGFCQVSQFISLWELNIRIYRLFLPLENIIFRGYKQLVYSRTQWKCENMLTRYNPVVYVHCNWDICDFFFSIWVFFYLTFTNHRKEGKGRSQVQLLSTIFNRFANT